MYFLGQRVSPARQVGDLAAQADDVATGGGQCGVVDVAEGLVRPVRRVGPRHEADGPTNAGAAPLLAVEDAALVDLEPSAAGVGRVLEQALEPAGLGPGCLEVALQHEV